ncbi:MAG TPA: ATP-binding protein [Terriglobia bacterium]|jgi:nitrogen fixation/metabolism regulation signal transduction histidine kinase
MKVPPQSTKLYAAGLFLLALALLVFVQAAFNLDPLFRPTDPNQILLLFTLSTFVFLALLIFGFILLRTLVKVWAERKEQKPGSKFKTSLLTSLICLTLIEATCLFLFAFGLVNRSLEKWFSVPVDQIFSATTDISAQWRQEYESLARSILSHVAQEPEPDTDQVRHDFRLKAFIVLDNNGRVIRSSAEPDVEPAELVQRIHTAVADQNDAFIDADPYWIAIRRTREDDTPEILAAVFPKPRQIAESTAKIAANLKDYHFLAQQRKGIRDTYVIILLLTTVLVLFASVWVGLFWSKRITGPIEALSEATREISAGNLDHRVHVQAQDELGLLVTLFNDMAGQLQSTTRELEARRRYTEIILESIPTGVISVDQDLQVNKVNRAARTMFSAENASTLNQIFGQDADAIRGLFHASESASVTREIEFNSHGRPAHSAVTATQLTAGGFVLVIEDLTEVVRAQKANAWREVARRLAHEIKNPLTPIQLSAERISRNIARLPAAPQRVTTVIDECVHAIVEEVSSLKNLVDEFVRFARLPAVARVPNSMRDLLDKTMALYEGRIDNVKVAVDIPSNLPPILMDFLQMKRVLVNLLDNALEALSGEPVQELSLRCELTRDETMVRLTLTDSGRGIAADDRERLFTPYFSTRKNGTGLGLAISSRIVADHGGYIGVEPNFPRGTRFVLELPVCQESSLSMTSPVSGSR